MAATAEVVILPSSSPAPIFAPSPTPVSYSPERLFGLSPRDNSSPSMLSPTSLFRSSHSARAQSRRSREGFAGGDVRSQNPGIGSEDILIMSAAPEELKEKPKRRARKGTQGKETTAVNLDQLSPETTTEEIRKPAEVKKGRKRNTSKKQEKGNKTLKGKVAKVGAGKLNDSGKAMLPDQTVENASNTGFDWEKDGLQLEEATKRRLDWTPTKNSKDSTKTTAAELVGNIDTNGDDVGGSQASCRRSFGNLLSTYGFDGESRAPEDAVRNLGGEGPTKRRRIELVDSNVFTLPTFRRLDTTDASSGDSAAETAAQEITKKPRKKKMTTITAHATARYVPDYEGGSNTLSRYLVVDEYQPTTEKATSKQKTSKTKKSHGTKDEAQGFTVVHPEAAFKSLEDQELLFGTCSQLEREESPTFVREVQKAIRASEADIQTEEGYHPTQSTMSHASGATTVSRFTASRNLWSVAARDSSGSLVQAEVVDLVDSPDASKVSSEILHQGILPVGRQKSPPQDNTTGLQSSPVASTEKAASRIDKSLSSLQAANQGSYISQSEHRSDPELAQGVSEQAVTRPEMPQYTGFTDAELAKKIASYGFKPVKGRNKMIELLQKCWESRLPDSVKHAKKVTPAQSKGLSGSEMATASRETGNQSQARKPAKADSAGSQSKRTAGRKGDRAAKPASKRPSKKTTTSENQEKPKPRFQDVEEIEDSEEELIPSPSRMWSRYIPRDATPVSLPLSAVPSPAREQNNTKKPSRSYQLPEDFPELSTKVMEAIRAQPRRPSVNGRPCLTWHEKILMYDPIVPEDLTAWLNTEGLNLVGEDEEVSPHFVRKWCESHGICCCPKKT